MWLEYFLMMSRSFQSVGVVFAIVVQVKSYGGARAFALGGLDFEAGFAVARPAPGVFLPGLARHHFDAVGNHERAVETHAELADEVRIALGIP